MERIIIPCMDDFHFHPRDDDGITEMVMNDLLDSGFARGIPIFNYKESVENARQLERELERLHRIAPKFQIIPSIMLTRDTTPEIVRDAHSAGAKVIKWIPNGLSTNSENGIGWNDLPEKYPCYRETQRLGMRSMNHVEDSFLDENGNPTTHPILREGMALWKFDAFAKEFPDMMMTIEHVSSEETMDYILHKAPPNVRGTVTVHHLLRTIYHVYDEHGCIRPDEWCMPVYKFEHDRDALVEAVVSGNPKFFYASDKASHRNKNPLKPPAGVYAGLVDICLLAEIFERHGALGKLWDFVSRFGAKHYSLVLNKGMVTLVKKEWTPVEEVDGVRIFWGGKKLSWMVESVEKN